MVTSTLSGWLRHMPSETVQAQFIGAVAVQQQNRIVLIGPGEFRAAAFRDRGQLPAVAEAVAVNIVTGRAVNLDDITYMSQHVFTGNSNRAAVYNTQRRNARLCSTPSVSVPSSIR